MSRLPRALRASGKPSTLSWTGGEASTTFESSSGTGMPENGRGGGWLRWATAHVLSHITDWQRARAERAEMHERESLGISRWLAEKAPTQAELYEQQYIDGLKAHAVAVLTDGESAVLELVSRGINATTPISSARSGPTRETVEEKIKRMTTKVDPVWDVASMIDAHRNGCTALERPVQVFEDDAPVWQELTAQKWDPTHEMGPRERDYVRKQAKR